MAGAIPGETFDFYVMQTGQPYITVFHSFKLYKLNYYFTLFLKQCPAILFHFLINNQTKKQKQNKTYKFSTRTACRCEKGCIKEYLAQQGVTITVTTSRVSRY